MDIKRPRVVEGERFAQGKERVYLNKNSTVEGLTEGEMPINSETSLRHFFYQEYRKMSNGERNPIVYSRFGKSSYDANEKFNPENFSQLIRTCNIKKLMQNMPGDSKQTYSNTLINIKDYRREDFGYHHRYVSQSAPPQRCYY